MIRPTTFWRATSGRPGQMKELLSTLQGVVQSKDSVSKELYDAAYQLADNRGAVSGDDVVVERERWLADVVEMRSRLARLAAIEAEQKRLKGTRQ